ncbi:cytochrome bd-I ubiquinol oxidase subunit 2 apoprotein [Nonomuraea fuscirosea]|uniref:Cytochrome bd-I ubiquinol oxidase subunit 2 apoprotein n=1 Tax=Nonomuraea fuscirosea TaxID=1291556 RepID=A0A2T0MT07_9ACTN|nr:cytochrome d ubiquinol oxidase subunit II [Nonomuraea fuscirosea]PRX61749.1 cytochrome bd-I ubiquinol oxidase subunit 2 apoprotein [Nonomuraea fuscirosea]
MTEIPMLLILAGLAAYTVLAGADFGAGLWTLLAGGRESRDELRHYARHAMGPVWEANHVWLIFVLVVCWTAYPVAFGSIMSTLAVPLFLAAVGIILRGASYALRGQLDGAPGERPVEYLFALSSILTPFALGTVVGGIASGRVPVGNAAGDLVTSWLNPTSVFIGALAVATGAYLSAVYLAADAHRVGSRSLESAFRTRALVAGGCAGALALAGLILVRYDAPALSAGLTSDGGAVMVAVSGLAGLATLLLVWRHRFGPARASAALAVAAMVAGWALAQRPYVLRGLTLDQAAAGRSTLTAVIVTAVIGVVVLFPALFLLFRLFLRGDLDHGAAPAAAEAAAGPSAGPARGAAGRSIARGRHAAFAGVTLVAGVAMTVLAGPGWVLAVGVILLVACAAATFTLVAAES